MCWTEFSADFRKCEHRHANSESLEQSPAYQHPEYKYRVFQKTALQWYSKCCCVESVTKTFTLKGVHRSTVPTWRPSLVGEVIANFYGYRV
jgi:hypothetical protein